MQHTIFDYFRFMELAEMRRCRASLAPPQTHQGDQLSSSDMAVAVCWGCPRCSARWDDTSISVCGCATARERAIEQRTSKRASRERATERRASERASGTQQTVAHNDTSVSVCGSQRASERVESEQASKRRAGERVESERANEYPYCVAIFVCLGAGERGGFICVICGSESVTAHCSC